MAPPPLTPGDGPPFAWRLAVGVVVWVMRRLFGWRMHTEVPDELPPPDAPTVVVYNHTSNVDPFIVADQVWRRTGMWVQPLAKAELFDVPLLGTVGRAAGAIPVARGEAAGREQAFDAAEVRLSQGGTVLVAPEGTITHDGSLLPLRHGAARMALASGAQVMVVTHFGAQRGFSPVVRRPERGVFVSLAVDVLRPVEGEDAQELTGRIAATMIDRAADLRHRYPQRDTEAAWWPPYAVPASPSATAREHLEQYRASMAEAVASARERMAQMAAEQDLEARLTAVRERARLAAEELAEDVAERSRQRAESFREMAHEAADDLRHRAEEMGEHARHTIEQRAAQARERAAEMVHPHQHEDDDDAA